MGRVDDKSKSEKPTEPTMATRQIRGLSQRLHKPLSLESNVPEVAPVLETPEPPQEAPPAPAPTPPPAGQTTRVAVPAVKQAEQAAAVKSRREGILVEGLQLQNRYKILGMIGVGGMSAVYKAQDMRFPGVVRLCALKEMINTAQNPQMREMIVRNFEREASILATLSHPAIPQVYDYFTEGARSYLVMEFITGKDLESRIAEAEGFFQENVVIDWIAQLCDVLSYLHNHKPRPIIFRDLKPSNIMLDDHNRIRLIDFGIAKLFQSGEKGTMIGTEGYSPPEQYRGVAEPRGDIYALGATMHHILSKQNPQLEPPFSFHDRPIHKTNPTVSRELIEVVDKSLQYDINLRWGSAEEFKRALLGVPTARGLAPALVGETATFSGGTVKPVWRFACEDEIRGSVAVSQGMVYIPCYDNNVYALLADSGKFAWKYATEGGVVSTPWVSEGMVIVGSTDKIIYALDAKAGNLLWTAPTKGKIFSSPFGEFNHIFIGSDDRHIYAIHQMSGRQAWTYATDGEVRARPLLAENMIFFTCQMGVVYCLSLNRELRWRFRARRGILAAPVVGKSFVFVGALDNNFYALDLRSGWTAWRYRAGGPIISTAVAWEDTVFFGSVDGNVYALDATEGRVVWRYETEGQVTGSPACYNGVVYIGGVDGALYSIDAKSGALRWRYATEGPITGTPVIVDDIIYVGSSDHYVYAIPT